MTGRTAIVTDSTAYLPASVVAEHAIRVVPLQVVIGGRSYAEGVDAKSSDVAAALRAWVPVSTSRPGPAAFLDTYEQLADDGADAVVSVHLSAEMSGTFESAVLAARDSPVPVRVVDSRSMGMGMGYAVVTASRVAAGGAGPDEVAAAAEKRAAATTAVFYVDTLEYLRRGGRIGAGAALLGSALAVKPLLHLVDGRIEPLEKVRTATRAIARMEELAVGHAGDAEVDVAVHHLANPDRAESLAERMRARLPHLGHLHVSEVGAVVGAHVGPGMLAVVVAPR
ncbi:MAG: fatty acid kinase fatty acid binding subunit [Actinomycetota bacterium]|jgi:DegV family protein with EDD domain|nr:fatty acid kinase fatty acid binding subunit [Actinomycetota bacterium]